MFPIRKTNVSGLKTIDLFIQGKAADNEVKVIGIHDGSLSYHLGGYNRKYILFRDFGESLSLKLSFFVKNIFS